MLPSNMQPIFRQKRIWPRLALQVEDRATVIAQLARRAGRPDRGIAGGGVLA